MLMLELAIFLSRRIGTVIAALHMLLSVLLLVDYGYTSTGWRYALIYSLFCLLLLRVMALKWHRLYTRETEERPELANVSG